MDGEISVWRSLEMLLGLAAFFFALWWPDRYIRNENEAISALKILSVVTMLLAWHVLFE